MKIQGLFVKCKRARSYPCVVMTAADLASIMITMFLRIRLNADLADPHSIQAQRSNCGLHLSFVQFV